MKAILRQKPVGVIKEGMVVIFRQNPICPWIEGPRLVDRLLFKVFQENPMLPEFCTQLWAEVEVHHPHAGVSKKGTGPGVGKRITSTHFYIISRLEEVGQLLEEDLVDSPIVGKVDINPYGVLWETSGDESMAFRPTVEDEDSIEYIFREKKVMGDHGSVAEELLKGVSELEFSFKAALGSVQGGYFNKQEAYDLYLKRYEKYIPDDEA